MNKSKKFNIDKKSSLILIIIMFLVSWNTLVAQQSDYQVVENFKEEYSKLSKGIKGSNNKQYLESSTKDEINSLKMKYDSYKDLIDESIYPENFISYFKNLEEIRINRIDQVLISNDLEVTKNENFILNEKLGKLTSDYDKISNHNSLLSKQINFLQKQSKKDKETISRINSLIADLKENVKKRDNLVINMLDSLFGDFEKSNLSEIDRDNFLNRVENNNFFGTVVYTINENIKFLKSSFHSAEDISFAVREFDKFTKLWNQISPNLLSTYYESDKSTKIIEVVNVKFSEWSNTLESVTWSSLNDRLLSSYIEVNTFKDGTEFKNSIVDYIDNEISINSGSEPFVQFVDSTWNTDISNNWIPILLENKYITKLEVQEIENRLIEWENSSTNWILIISLVIFALIIILFVIKILLNVNKDDK